MYSDLTTARQYLGVGLGKTADDATLTRLLSVAQKQIEQYTGRVFEASADTVRYFDPTYDVMRGTLWLGHDLAGITGILNDGQAVLSTEYTTQPRNDPPWYALKLRANSSVYWTWTTDPTDAISITGRWAYSITPPADIVQATLRLVGYAYRLRDAQVFDVTSDPASGQLIIPKGMPADVKVMLQPYIRVSL